LERDTARRRFAAEVFVYRSPMFGTRTTVTVDDIDRMRSRLFIAFGPDRGAKRSAFIVLLLLSAVIASAGVVADSTATVIGAMIVAPLMTPILGTALALVLAERKQLLINIGLVLAGALAVIAIGYLMGLLHLTELSAATNSQIAGRVSPRMIDLIAALATGAVGAFALVRSDVSDTLPGVAIAISLVPPLAVVGLTLESGVPDEAMGALLLFTTNVAAIICTGTVVLLFYRVRNVLAESGRPLPPFSKRTLAVVIGSVVVVALPLAAGSVIVAVERYVVRQAQPVADAWAQQEGWVIQQLTFQQGALQITAIGPLPQADPAGLRSELDAAGLESVDAQVTLIVGGTKELPSTDTAESPEGA
jgi:uncharacterized hydrophobic protein (TIGR00271 family)